MPDPTYKTFLSPGSCQLEITDLVATANDDTGIDIYGVAWEIEQVLIAGEGFAASPTDVWVNERGILNIGQSLFDKINRTAEDNDNVPGQCTVIVKATSLYDHSKVARLKVLVGYPGEGGGGGGGGVTLGTLSLVFMDDAMVAVGDDFNGGPSICSISVDDQTVTDVSIGISNSFIDSAAAGATVEAYYQFIDGDVPLADVVFRWCTINPETFKYATISDPIDLASTTSEKTLGDTSYGVAVFTMPEQATEGACLLLSPVIPN